MLDKYNDIDTIKTAFICVEIAPFEEFAGKLETLVKEHENESIKNQAKLLIDEINKKSYKRNVKWDD